MDNVLDIRAEEALAALFQPDAVAPAADFKIYERKPGLEREKKLMLAVLEDAMGWWQHFVCATDNQQKKGFLKAEKWFNEEKGEDVCVSLAKLQQALTARPTAHGVQTSAVHRQNSIGDVTCFVGS